MKTKEEWNTIKNDQEKLCRTMAELSENELLQITGGTDRAERLRQMAEQSVSLPEFTLDPPQMDRAPVSESRQAPVMDAYTPNMSRSVYDLAPGITITPHCDPDPEAKLKQALKDALLEQ